MPFRRSSRRTSKRPFRRTLRRFRRSFRRKGRGPAVSRQRGLVISDRQVVHLKYVDTRNFAPALTFAERQYNLNSCFDPDRTGVGSQPVGWDQWTNFYGRYRVFAASWRYSAAGGTGSAGFMVVPVPSNFTAPFVSLQECLESRYAKAQSYQNGANVARGRGRISIPKLVGRTPSAFRGSDLNSASTSADPAENAILHLCFASMDTISVVAVNYTLEIWYHVELFDRNDLAVS